jgi:hypothetical protein
MLGRIRCGQGNDGKMRWRHRGNLPHGELRTGNCGRGITVLRAARLSGLGVPGCHGTAVPGLRVRCARGEVAYGGTEHARGTTAWARGPAGRVGAAGDSGNSGDHGSPGRRARGLLTGCEDACRRVGAGGRQAMLSGWRACRTWRRRPAGARRAGVAVGRRGGPAGTAAGPSGYSVPRGQAGTTTVLRILSAKVCRLASQIGNSQPM